MRTTQSTEKYLMRIVMVAVRLMMIIVVAVMLMIMTTYDPAQVTLCGEPRPEVRWSLGSLLLTAGTEHSRWLSSPSLPPS